MQTLNFEVIKSCIRQSKDGFNLTLVINEEDAPEELLRDPVGSRYMAVFVRINDDEKPLNRELEEPGVYAVKRAGELCRDENFAIFAEETLGKFEKEDTATWLRSYLNIKSRKDLKTDTLALEKFQILKLEFDKWKK